MSATTRITAIDAMRGLAVAGMVLVNTPGSWVYMYSPLRHAGWNGFRLADFVFPFFLFVAGVSTWFSFSRYEHKFSPLLARKILVRVLVIFAAGVFLNAYPFLESLSSLRVMGVLQRIALAWGVAAFLSLFLKRRQLLITSAVILAGYWLVLSLWGDFSLENNLVRSLDLKLLGENHLWRGRAVPFDPEGLLGTFPAVVTVLSGYLAGSVIGGGADYGGVFKRMFPLGVLTAAAGLIWGTIFPINKSLWTSSYVLLTSGVAFSFLAGFIWITEVKSWKRAVFPLTVFGRNPLFLFILSSLWVKTGIYLIRFNGADGSRVTAYNWFYDKLLAPLAGRMFGSLLFALIHIVFFWLLLYLLYRKRIFIKI
ncbi:DUF1624 domain-containing protein [bacterium]|nr:DUF1624 domain-containing protein [bacterium]